MSLALHLKYRPQTLAELVGQNYIQIALTNAVKNQQIAPAYLFTGVRGTGKTSTARILAKSLNCQKNPDPTINPCGKCPSCGSISKSTNLDVTEIDAASHNGVDDARELIQLCNFAPTQSRYRIFIVDECHQLTTASQNCLLKAIEEPPSHVIFILCTTELHKVLPTIVSRCQTFNFKALSVETIARHLAEIAETESIKIAPEALLAIARTAEGGLRDALQLLSQLSLLHQQITPAQVRELTGAISERDLLELLQAINQADTYKILQIARGLIDSGKTPPLILTSLLAVYRDLLIVKSAAKSQNLLQGGISYSRLYPLAQKFDLASIEAAFCQLHKSESQLKTTLKAAVWLEVFLLNLVHHSSSQTSNGHNGGCKNIAHAPSSDLTSIWADVVDAAKPNNRGLLSHARLTALDRQKAVLAVESKYLSKFQTHSQLLTKMIGKSLGKSVTVTIEEKK